MSIRTTLITLFLVVMACSCSPQGNQLNVSLQRFAKNYLPEYEPVESSKNDSLTDIGGEWAIQLKGGPKAMSLPDSEFERADQEDIRYFKERLIRSKLLDHEEGEFVLYRAELKLGKGSSCDSIECSIYVMHKAEDPMVYIGIYKN